VVDRRWPERCARAQGYRRTREQENGLSTCASEKHSIPRIEHGFPPARRFGIPSRLTLVKHSPRGSLAELYPAAFDCAKPNPLFRLWKTNRFATDEAFAVALTHGAGEERTIV
jgi:hypothetical protein